MMKTTFSRTLFASALLGFAFAASAATHVRYVATNGDDSADGLTDKTPYATVSNAVAQLTAAITGDDEGLVYVAAGTYPELCPKTDYLAGQSCYTLDGGATSNKCGWSCIDVKKAIRIIGATGNPSDVTIKRKNNTGRIFFLDHEKASVENITITGGTQGYSGSNRYTTGVNGSNAFITPNGGTISNCVISGGSASYWNTHGGNLYMKGGRVVRSKIVSGSGHTGGVYAQGGVIENSLFTANKTDEGYGVVYLDGTAELVNCTVAGNTGSSSSAGVYASGSAKVVNCAIFENTTTTDTTDPKHQHVWSGTASCFDHCAGEVLINANCFAGSPGFTDSANGDYSIGSSSVCVDKGADYATTSAISTTDYVNFKRVSGKSVDIGAYEMDADKLAVDFTWSVSSGLLPLSVEFTAAPNAAGVDAVYEWDFNNDGTIDETTTELKVTHVYGAAGYHSVKLTLTSGGVSVSALHEECVTVAPADFYVDAANWEGAEYPYDRWDNAATKIKDALDHVLDGCTIHVKGGYYTESKALTLDKDVRIVGDSGMPRDVVVSGPAPLFTMNHAESFVSGLTVTNVCASQNPLAPAFHFKTFGGTVSNCVITRCSAEKYYPNSAGVYMENGLITHCEFKDNCFNVNGGDGERVLGAYLTGSSRAENCLFHDFNATNSWHCGAGVVICLGASTVVRNCTVADWYSCAYNRNSKLYYAKAFIANNGQVVNCVMANCRASSNTTDFVEAYLSPWGGGAARFDHCATESAEPINDNCICFDSTAKVFRGRDHGDFTPSVFGVLRDAGATVELSSSTDLAGNRRVFGKAIDIGAYECQKVPGLKLFLR